jgi:predicted transcriptional regulator
MVARLSPEASIQATTEILVAFLQNASIGPDDLPTLIRKVRAAVEADLPGGADALMADDEAESTGGAKATVASGETTAKPAPAVPIEDSIHQDYIVSLEDGGRYRSLRRHLMSKYGMTPDDYRARWNLPPDYPMVAPSYAEARSNVAKRIGLGRSPAKKQSNRQAP